MVLTEVQKQIVRFGRDRLLAHRVIFQHRHPQRTPEFHDEIILDWASDAPYVLDLVFRGGAKSSIAEEELVLGCLYQEFRNGLILGESAERAIERLSAVRHELRTNEIILKLFGYDFLQVDSDTEIVTKKGTRVLALGRGQALRGVKFLDARPDMVFADDIEKPTDMITPAARKKVFDWFTKDVLPACDPTNMRVRMAATPLHPESTPMLLAKDPNWIVHRYPIYHLDPDTGERVPTWPERWPLKRIASWEQGFIKRGDIQGWNQEYMCEAESPESKAFKPEMMGVFPQAKSWQAAYSMTDPARTTGPNAATTGHVVWSWVGPKLVIWDGWGERLMPDAIVSRLYQCHEEFKPVWMGFEEDGLNQWALQPIRQEGVRRGVVLPLRAVRAPPGKLDFIRGLQPFFMAREVQFAKEMPELKAQLLSFPSGAIDIPNALAYAMKMRPGAPVYDDFGSRHVAEDLRPAPGRPVWLALHATRSCLSGVALQSLDGSLRVFADFVREGDPASLLGAAVADIQIEIGAQVRLIAGPSHFDRYNNVGLVAAAKRLPREIQAGVAAERGRPVLENLLQRERGGLPMVLVGQAARWTLNGFAGGYARVMLRGGQLADYAEEGPYRTLMEGIESFLGLTALGSTDDEDEGRSFAYTADGRRYVSMLGNR